MAQLASFAIRCSFGETGIETRCSRHRSLQRFRAPTLPSLHRVPWGGFPCLVGNMKCSDSLPSVPAAPRVAIPVPLVHSLFAPGGRRVRPPPGLEGSGPAPPGPPFPSGDGGSPRFLGNPMCACPVLRPRRDLYARPLRRFDVAFRLLDSVGSRDALLTRLNGTAYTRPVYASRSRLPHCGLCHMVGRSDRGVPE